MGSIINPDADAHELHAKRERVWAEVLEWHGRQLQRRPQELVALYDLFQKGTTELREVFSRMDDDELDIVSRLATAAMIEAAYRHYVGSRTEG